MASSPFGHVAFAPVQNLRLFLGGVNSFELVRLDEKGEIISANYAKLLGDIEFEPRGRIKFSYVFNPNPNDRNLEYHSKANFLKGVKREEEVRTPRGSRERSA